MTDRNGKRRARKTSLLTTRVVESLKPRQSASESLGYGTGALEAQGTKSRARYYFRFGRPQRRIPLPASNEQGEPLSLAEARVLARALSARFLALKADGRDLVETMEAERLAAKRKRNPEREGAGKPITFGALMEAYLSEMERAGKSSAYDTANTIANHVQPHLDLWGKPANDLTLDDVLSILEPLTEVGKLTTARKVRAFIRRAYALGERARTSAQASAFRHFGISHNPVADSSAIEGANRPRERALSLSELQALWYRINDAEEPGGPLLRAYLLLGGQRLEQLRRATVANLADGQLTLWDPKGKRQQPRRHEVPVLPEADTAIREMRGAGLGPYLFTRTQGETPADRSRTGKMVKAISSQMLETGESTAPFTLGDLRRTVETRLAAAGIQSDTLAQLQSHGLSGVQWRHYNRYDYHAEKLTALITLRDLMATRP